MMEAKSWIALLEETFKRWNDHQATRLSASVAFYTLFSIAPLLIFLTAVVALVFSQEAAQNGLIREANELVGKQGADLARGLLKNSHRQSSGIVATLIAFGTLLFGASRVFGELRDALNTIWDAKAYCASGWRGMIVEQLFSFGMVLSVGFLLMISLIVSAALEYLGEYLGSSFETMIPLSPGIFQLINFAVSFAVITFLFGLIFKFVPAVRISWRDVLVGAVGTALLFTIGKFLLGLYLGKASVGSAYGVAGSVVAVIVWVYYSAQIFFFGAEFTRVHADERARRAAAAEARRTGPSAAAHKAY